MCNSLNSVISHVTLADKLWPPFKMLVFSPLVTGIFLLIFYFSIVIFYVPLWLLSFLVTSVGSFLIFIALLVLAARSIGRSIAFPGSTPNVQREISSDFIRRVLMQLESISTLSSNFNATLLAMSSGQLRVSEIGIFQQRASEIMLACDMLGKLADWINKVKRDLSTNLKPEEIVSIGQLGAAALELSNILNDLRPTITSYVSGSHQRSSSSTDRASENATVLQALRASQALKSCVDVMKPKKIEADGIWATVNTILKINTGPTGYEKLSFPMMREQLMAMYNAERISLTGPDHNVIDGMYIKCAKKISQKTRVGELTPAEPLIATSKSGDISSVGTVLFCCPNAGMYECMALASRDQSWVGLYTKLGLDVCICNYRGYASSTGVPTPDRLKSDVEVIVRYLRDVKKVPKLVVHGESIGGMMACHAVSRCGADVLVCDRTFSSLDAVAERLLGPWASWGVRWVCYWNTDVVADFMACRTAARILLQDPNDEIISHCSSLKSGVATFTTLRDAIWSRRDLPWKYAVAECRRQKSVAGASQSVWIAGLLESAAKTSSPLAEDFIEHFSACVINISRRANAILKRKARGKGAGGKETRHGHTHPLRPGSSTNDDSDSDEELVNETNDLWIEINSKSSASTLTSTTSTSAASSSSLSSALSHGATATGGGTSSSLTDDVDEEIEAAGIQLRYLSFCTSLHKSNY